MEGRRMFGICISRRYICAKRVGNPEKIKIYKKGEEQQHAIKSLFTWLSGLQLQPDPLLPPPSQNLNSLSLFYSISSWRTEREATDRRQIQQTEQHRELLLNRRAHSIV